MNKTRWNHNWEFWKDGEKNRRKLDLPHDAMLEEQRDPDMQNGSASGFFPGGKYYYAKQLFGEEEYRDGTVQLEFEGIYMNSTILLNGIEVGGWHYGYTNFYVDLTGKLKIGEENEVLVIVDNSKTPNSRWYSGSGIYRNVNLYTAGKAYIDPEGIRITTLNINPAKIQVDVGICGQADILHSEYSVQTQIHKAGELIVKGIGTKLEFEIPDAKLWTAETPELYTAVITLWDGDRLLDSEQTQFGIRTLSWNVTEGLLVNGDSVKLKGGCIHHDNGPLGAAAYEKAGYRKVRKMKELGYNAVRFSHNPADKAFLYACDELGMYVLDETFDQWKVPQSTYDYAIYFDENWEKDLEALISKDYNHPSVIMYCVGNEITDTGLAHGGAVCKMLCKKVKELDNTRPITIAINSMLSVLAARQAERMALENQKSEEEKEQEKKVGSAEVNDIIALLPKLIASITPESLEQLIHDVVEAVDIVGYNYGENLYEGTHGLAPERVILSSETFPAKIGEHWPMVEHTPYVIGDFMWTAWDYLGEAGVGLPFYGADTAPFAKAYPCLTAGCGSIDLTGYVESQGRYTSVIFGAEKNPCIAVRPLDHAGEAYTVGKWRLTDAVDSWSWSGQEGKEAEIEVYSIGSEVELWQDDVLLERKALENYRAFFKTTYTPGVLRAVSFDVSGEKIGESQLVSAGEEEQLTLFTEDAKLRADRDDFTYVHIQITDAKGITKLLRDRKLTVSVQGAGRLLALASGNPETTENFKDNSYTTYHGRLLAIVQSDGHVGEMRVEVSGEGLESKQLVLVAR